MTCEIAILNRNAVALAADRAVTVGDCKKIFTDADKIFQLHPETPVAVMIYGCAEMMGVPLQRVMVDVGDTRLPPGPLSGGSMVTASV